MCLGKAMGVVETHEKGMSLLKQKTNFDNLKNMSSWDFAGKMDEFIGGDCDICPFSSMIGDVQECRLILIDEKPSSCKRKYYKWLESKAE